MPYVEGIRGRDPFRWCGCGHHLLEVVGQYHLTDPDSGEKVIEFSHLPKCPVCIDMIKKGEVA